FGVCLYRRQDQQTARLEDAVGLFEEGVRVLDALEALAGVDHIRTGVGQVDPVAARGQVDDVAAGRGLAAGGDLGRGFERREREIDTDGRAALPQFGAGGGEPVA